MPPLIVPLKLNVDLSLNFFSDIVDIAARSVPVAEPTSHVQLDIEEPDIEAGKYPSCSIL